MTRRKNVLFLANRVPFPPDKGDKIRTFHQLDWLALSHRVYCACFAESRREMEHAQSLKRWCIDIFARRWTRAGASAHAAAGRLRGMPLTTSAYQDRGMSRHLERWAGTVSFDVVVAFSSMMAPYALAVPAKRRVLDLCDADSQKWLDYARGSRFPRSALYRAEGSRLRQFEKECLRRFDATVVVHERERDIVDPKGRCSTLHVISNGTTLCEQLPAPPSRCGPVVGFVGALDYRPNVQGICWFVQEVWPRVVNAVPEARLMVVGRNPTRSVRRLSRVSRVEVVGEVRDPRTWLTRFRVAVAPLDIARGLQNKVLEAMAMRRPVVATSAVSGGLQAEPGHSILVAGDAESFAEKVIELCQFGEFCDTIGDAGYRCVAANYSWAETLQRYEALLMDAPRGEESADAVSPRDPAVERQITRGAPKAPAASLTRRVPTGSHNQGRSPYAALLRGEARPVPAQQTAGGI